MRAVREIEEAPLDLATDSVLFPDRLGDAGKVLKRGDRIDTTFWPPARVRWFREHGHALTALPLDTLEREETKQRIRIERRAADLDAELLALTVKLDELGEMVSRDQAEVERLRNAALELPVIEVRLSENRCQATTVAEKLREVQAARAALGVSA